MRKKILLSALALTACVWTQAQIAEVSAPRPLLKGTQSEMYYPVLSADGTQLMFSKADYSDLRVYNYASGATKAVNTTRPEAFRARFVGDKVSTAQPATGTSVSVKGSKLIITTNGTSREYTPVDCYAGYCWPSLSPDGTKVMFVAAGKGIYITDLKGNILSHPGKYEAPVWYGNNHIVAMNAKDDGHQYMSSQIVLLSTDGAQVQNLTKPESMSMYPAAAISANRVVYNTIDGRLYEMTVTIK